MVAIIAKTIAIIAIPIAIVAIVLLMSAKRSNVLRIEKNWKPPLS